MSGRAFLAWIILLGAPTAALFGMLGDFGSPRSPGIGGGAYDLSGPLYATLLVALTGGWTVGALLATLRRRPARGWNLALAAAGAGSLLAAFLLHGHQLPFW